MESDEAASPVIKIKIPAEAKAIVTAIAKREDMTQEGVAGRIYQWFSEQPSILQRWVLGHIDDDLRADALRKLVDHFQGLLDDTEITEEGDPEELKRRSQRLGSGGGKTTVRKP